MASLFETVQEFFIREGFPGEQVMEETLLIKYRVRDAAWDCVARVREEWGQATFYSIMPGFVPKSKLSAVAEYIARANFGLVIGNFELDFSDGEIRFRTSIDLGPKGHQNMPFTRLFGRAVANNLRAMKCYMMGVMDVIGGMNPAEAHTGILAEIAANDAEAAADDDA